MIYVEEATYQQNFVPSRFLNLTLLLIAYTHIARAMRKVQSETASVWSADKILSTFIDNSDDLRRVITCSPFICQALSGEIVGRITPNVEK